MKQQCSTLRKLTIPGSSTKKKLEIGGCQHCQLVHAILATLWLDYILYHSRNGYHGNII